MLPSVSSYLPSLQILPSRPAQPMAHLRHLRFSTTNLTRSPKRAHASHSSRSAALSSRVAHPLEPKRQKWRDGRKRPTITRSMLYFFTMHVSKYVKNLKACRTRSDVAMSSGEAVIFGSRVSWVSWFRVCAECNPYSTEPFCMASRTSRRR